MEERGIEGLISPANNRFQNQCCRGRGAQAWNNNPNNRVHVAEPKCDVFAPFRS